MSQSRPTEQDGLSAAPHLSKAYSHTLYYHHTSTYTTHLCTCLFLHSNALLASSSFCVSREMPNSKTGPHGFSLLGAISN